MTILRSGALLCSMAALLCSSIPAIGGEATQDAMKTPAPVTGKSRRKAAEASTGNWETYRDVKLQAGKSLALDSVTDFSMLDKVAVTIRSDGGGDGANDLSNISVKAYWSVPEADYYSATEVRSGKEFPYTTSGGFLFQIYGSQLRLILKNEGETDITIQQIIVYGRIL